MSMLPLQLESRWIFPLHRVSGHSIEDLNHNPRSQSSVFCVLENLNPEPHAWLSTSVDFIAEPGFSLAGPTLPLLVPSSLLFLSRAAGFATLDLMNG